MKKLIFAFLACIVFLSSCKKTIIDPPFETRLQFQYSGSFLTNFSDWTTLPIYTHYVDFDKRDYPKMDSITFNANIRTETLSGIASVRLWNVTDVIEIANSTLTATTNGWEEAKEIHTNNIASALPDKKITLAIQVKGVGQGSVSPPFLKLRRY